MVKKEIEGMSVRHQCELFALSRSGLYYTPSVETEENLRIMRFLDEQFLKTPFYGERRLLHILRQAGYRLNIKRLRRLMKVVRWRTLYPKRRMTVSDEKAQKYLYLLKDMLVERRNQVWTIDITYIPVKQGFMYLFTVIDLYSRYVVNWSVSNTMTAEWCVEVLEEAIAHPGKPEIINSDQGSQFTADCS